MKKRDFLFLGLILAAVPVGAQRPAETPQDAKVIFTQNFEPEDESMTADEAWEAWQAEVIDTIKELKFYKKASAGNINPSADINIYDGSEDWKIAYVRTDSTSVGADPGAGILLKNGVVITDGDLRAFPEDFARITVDETQERSATFAEYGEDGGKYVFHYVSGKPIIKDDKTAPWGVSASSSWDEYYEGITQAYRRNLFVRGLDIEENTSYRVTLFVKASAQGQTKPTFKLNMMRGYFNSETDFSMGYVDNNADNHPLEYSNTFTLTKDDFKAGKWEKITFMTHYLNDSISNAYVFTKNGYWWSGRWWAKDGDNTYDYIQQPDKFFLRLSFASDSTTFDVDNIAITKSTIGGVEHDGSMIRVNFGYDTNLKTLADNAYKSTGVAAIELPGQYFSVFGKAKANGRWVEIPINSAEYHDDGYMYMWSKDSETGGKVVPNPFTYYDSVFVSFTNPKDDDAICLKYTGDRFPYALDTTWIKEGKKLHGFSNELSVPNPNIVRNQFGKRVYSMKMLPPVLVGQQYEKGSFNLPGTLTSMDFKFSRPVVFEPNATNTTEDAILKVTKGGVTEFWFASSATGQADSTITFTRQQADITKNGALDGNYTFELCLIHGVGTDYAENVKIDYSFGSSDVQPNVVAKVDFNDEDLTEYVSNGPAAVDGFSSNSKCATKIGQFGGVYEHALMFGLYGVGGLDNGAPELTYTFDVATAGTYDVAFMTSGCLKNSWNDGCKMEVTLYDSEKNVLGQYVEESTNTKPEEGKEVSSVDENAITADFAVGTYTLVFKLPNENSYGGGHKGGRVLYEVAITSPSLLGWPYINKLRNTLNALNNKLTAAEDDEDRYTGVAYETSKAVAEEYDGFTDTKPSRYNTVIDSVSKAIDLLKARFDLVEALDKEYDRAIDTIASFEDDDERVDFTDMVVFDDLYELVSEIEDLLYSDMTDDSIKGVTKMVQDAITAIDNRMALIAAFDKQLAATEASIDEATFAEIQQYADMVQVYNDYKDFDKVAPTDDELKAATKAVLDGTLPYDSYVSGVQSSTVRIKALAELAEELEVTFSDDEDVDQSWKDRVASTIFDDVALAEVYKSAINVAILEILAEGDLNDEIDLTSFIRNFNMYTAATVKSESNPDGDLEYYRYNYGSPNDRWHMIGKHVSENAFPGWVTTAAGGNAHVGSEATNWNEPKAPTFDAFLALDWGSGVVMKQDVAGLPAGLYELGIGANSSNYNNGSNGKSITIQMAEQADSTYTVATSDAVVNDVPSKANCFVENVKVVDTLHLSVSVPSDNLWIRVDNFELKLTDKLEGHDYAADLAAEKAKLATLLTFVEAADQNASVSYYGIDGVPVAAPKAGAITIKVTDLGGGKLQVEKILVK